MLAYIDTAHRRQFAGLMRSMPNVTWVSNESAGVVRDLGGRVDTAADGRLVLAVGGEPVALTGPHGQSYEAL